MLSYFPGLDASISFETFVDYVCFSDGGRRTESAIDHDVAYREHLTDEMITAVAERYAIDIATYGYEF